MTKRFFIVFCVLTLSSLVTFAQSIPTATLTGKVMVDSAALPGVTVTVASPNLQGTRTTVTSEAGDYLFPLLPPGDYTVTFELSGMQTASRRIVLSAARTDRIDVDLRPAALAEAITVTADTPLTAALETTTVSTNFKQQEFFEKLPILRDLRNITLMAPGVSQNAGSFGIMMSGAFSFDNLFLVNGAIVNENLRGQPHDLFIEDAIQETTIMTGGISAEYGHFTGGVVSAITKSGGNDFSGSFRTNVSSESWNGRTPFTVDQDEDLSKTYEGTLGGPFFRDRLWFFGAARYQESSDIRQTRPGVPRTGDTDVHPITYPHGIEETRLEGKLTGAITPRHNMIFSYTDVDDLEFNNQGTTPMDLKILNAERETPVEMLAINYNGTLTDRFFVEAQYSEKDFGFFGGGARCFELICGTRITDRARGGSFNSPVFRFKPEGELRNHDLFTVKGTYFWSTQNLGNHDIKAGYEDFMELRKVNNYQGGSDYTLSINSSIIRGNQIFPRMLGGSTSTQTRILWQPIFVPSEGSEYAVQSVFLNDRWNLSNHWSFNLGVRYDKNDAVSGARTFQVADDSAISPRLAAHYDFFGDGRLVANASYGQYVGRLAEGVGNDGDPAGRTASIQWYYRGPSINSNVNAPTDQLIPTEEALRRVFDWFFAQGGTSSKPTRSVSIPGLDSILDPNGLKSPNVKEWTLGVGGRIGQRGFGRADLVYRNWDDFYTTFTDKQTGKTTDQFGNLYDLTIVRNSDMYEREYTGVQTQLSWKPTRKFNIGGTYTWSRLVGNLTGENSGNGPITGGAGSYREYREPRWNFPTGYLTGDQRHRLKAWAGYDINTPVGVFNLSLLQNFDTGNRTSTDGSIDVRPYVGDLDYEDPPTSVAYYFGGRGDVKHEDITRTDLAINYSVRLFGNKVELIFQPEVVNLFNEGAVLGFDEEILTALDEDYLKPFNPFTETPIECPQGAPAASCQQMGAHWQKGPNFGKPDSEGDFQQTRTVRFSIGLRF